MKKFLLLTLAGLATLLLLTACIAGEDAQSGQAQSGDATVVHSLQNNTFDPTSISIKKGTRIKFSDVSQTGSLHILVIGFDGQEESLPGAPGFGGFAGTRLNRGENWISPPWNTAGTYHVTCTVHPLMNLTVIVTS